MTDNRPPVLAVVVFLVAATILAFIGPSRSTPIEANNPPPTAPHSRPVAFLPCPQIDGPDFIRVIPALGCEYAYTRAIWNCPEVVGALDLICPGVEF